MEDNLKRNFYNNTILESDYPNTFNFNKDRYVSF